MGFGTRRKQLSTSPVAQIKEWTAGLHGRYLLALVGVGRAGRRPGKLLKC